MGRGGESRRVSLRRRAAKHQSSSPSSSWETGFGDQSTQVTQNLGVQLRLRPSCTPEGPGTPGPEVSEHLAFPQFLHL